MKEILTSVMDTVITGAISVMAAYIVYYVKQAVKKIKSEIAINADYRKKELFNVAADRVSNLAELTVAAIEQTTAGALRQAVKSGKADKQLLLDLGRDAVLQIKEQLTDEYKAVISEQCNDLDDYISNVVEAKVYELKQKQGA